MRSIKDNIYGMIDLGVVLMVGIAFVGLMVVAYIVWTIDTQLSSAGHFTSDLDGANSVWDAANNSLGNITGGFDDAVNLILIAVTIFILAIAISALLMLRGGR